MKQSFQSTLAAFTFLTLSCANQERPPADPLPSWNDTAAKREIIRFMEFVTKEGTGHFVPVSERIATFDNDGTLWNRIFPSDSSVINR